MKLNIDIWIYVCAFERISCVKKVLVLTNSKEIRSFRRREPKEEICGTILSYEDGTEYQTPMTSAQVVFRYPIVGRVIFRQPLDRPWEDTTVIIESMV